MQNAILKFLFVFLAYSSGLWAATPEELASDPRGLVPEVATSSRRIRVETAAQPRAGLSKRKDGKERQGKGAGSDAEEGKAVEMTFMNPIHTAGHPGGAHSGNVVVPVAADDASIRARLNAYMCAHLDAPFNKKEIAAAGILGGLLAYVGIQGIAPALTLFVNWGMPGGIYDNLSINQQQIFDLFSIRLCRSIQPFLRGYSLARGCDIVSRIRYAWNGQFADLFAPTRKGVAVIGYSVATVAAGILAANEVSIYYALSAMAEVFVKGSFNPAQYVDQYTTLAIYKFVELLDPMVTVVAGLTKPQKDSTGKALLERLAKAAQYINRLDDKETAFLHDEFKKSAADPVEQLRILTITGKGEELQKTPKYQYLVSIGAPLVIGGLVAYTQWLFARQLPTRFDMVSGSDLDMGVGHAAAVTTAMLKGGAAFFQVRSLGQYVKDIFACNKKWRTPRSNRKSLCYEVSNTVVSAAHSALLAMAVGLNIYSQLDPHATPDQEYHPQRQWIITLLSAYACAEIANHTVRFAQGNAYLPEVVTNTTKKITSAATRVKNVIAAKSPPCVKGAYGTVKAAAESYVPGWLSRGCNYVSGKINHFLTGRAPGEELSATQMRSEMISRLECGTHIVKAGSNKTVTVMNSLMTVNASQA